MKSNHVAAISKIVPTLANVAISLLAFGSVIMLQLYGQTSDSPLQQKLSTTEDYQKAVEAEKFRLQVLRKVPTFGFNNLMADWIFIQFLQYFGDDPAREVTGYNLNSEYFDLIIQRDPRWVEIYPFLSTAVSFYEGQPELTVQYMSRGIQSLSPEINPESWILWRYKAMDQLLLLGDIPGTIRSLQKAADWVEPTPDQSLATVFREAAQFLQQNPNSIAPRFWGWSTVYLQATDEFVRERAKAEIIKLGGRVVVNQNGEVQLIPPGG